MIIPVLCFTCGKVVGNKYERFCKMRSEGVAAKDALTSLGLHRICCRRMILNHVPQIDSILDYDSSKPKPQDSAIVWIERPSKRTKPNYCIAR